MSNPVKLRSVVTTVIKHGDGIYTVKMLPEGRIPRFKPGQFLHLTIDKYDPSGGFWPESRVFSIASAPGTAEIEIVYSVKGRYTKLMEEQLALGREVWLKLPYGDFIIDTTTRNDQDVVLVAGGTGVSPFLPYLKKLLSAGIKDRTIRLYYGARERSLLVDTDLISKCKNKELLDARFFIENAENPTEILAGIGAERGCLDIERIRLESLDLQNPVFFLSGPPMMIKTFKKKLEASGLADGCVVIDEWE